MSGWSQEEDRILKEFYHIEGPTLILLRLPNRTNNAVRARAYNKGYLFSKRHLYTQQDEDFIKQNYANKGWKYIAKILGSTKNSIIHKAASLGVRSGNKNRRKEANRQFKGYKEISGSYWYKIQRKAKMRGFIFNITLPYVWAIYQQQEGKCALSGIPIIFSSTTVSFDGCASLDRIDSSKGYIEGNVQWVHKDINRMKWNSDEKDFIEKCSFIAQEQYIDKLRSIPCPEPYWGPLHLPGIGPQS